MPLSSGYGRDKPHLTAARLPSEEMYVRRVWQVPVSAAATTGTKAATWPRPPEQAQWPPILPLLRLTQAVVQGADGGQSPCPTAGESRALGQSQMERSPGASTHR